MPTHALIRCKTSTEQTIDIHVKSDGSPDTLGVVLGQACEKILWGTVLSPTCFNNASPAWICA